LGSKEKSFKWRKSVLEKGSPGKHTHGGAEEEKSQRRGGVSQTAQTESPTAKEPDSKTALVQGQQCLSVSTTTQKRTENRMQSTVEDAEDKRKLKQASQLTAQNNASTSDWRS